MEITTADNDGNPTTKTTKTTDDDAWTTDDDSFTTANECRPTTKPTRRSGRAKKAVKRFEFDAKHTLFSSIEGHLRRNERRWKVRKQRIDGESRMLKKHRDAVAKLRASKVPSKQQGTHPPKYARLHDKLFPIGTIVKRWFEGIPYIGECKHFIVHFGEFHYYRIVYANDREDLDQNEMVEAAYKLPDLEDALPVLADFDFE